MPIDLDEYSPSLKAALKKSRFACVFVASVQCGRPARVGFALDLTAAIRRFQNLSPLAIEVHDAMWVPDRSIATMIAQAVNASIAPHRGAGGWHDLSAESIAGEVLLATSRLYPSANTVPHSQLVADWRTRRG